MSAKISNGMRLGGELQNDRRREELSFRLSFRTAGAAVRDAVISEDRVRRRRTARNPPRTGAFRACAGDSSPPGHRPLGMTIKTETA
jgi:hypothetical protein